MARTLVLSQAAMVNSNISFAALMTMVVCLTLAAAIYLLY